MTYASLLKSTQDSAVVRASGLVAVQAKIGSCKCEAESSGMIFLTEVASISGPMAASRLLDAGLDVVAVDDPCNSNKASLDGARLSAYRLRNEAAIYAILRAAF